MGEHTPGPWRAALCDVHPTFNDDGRRFFDIRAGDETRSQSERHVSGFIDCGGVSVALVQFGPREANASLIASAPDLLEALQELLRALTEQAHDPRISDVRVERAYIGARAAIAKAKGSPS